MARKPRKKLSRFLTATDRESIYQTFLLTRNKAETARIHNRSPLTVSRAIKEIEKDNALVAGEHKEARASVAEIMQGRVLKKSSEVLDSIVADDLANGVHTEITYDDNNNIVHKRMYGARGLEKSTMFGILTDKLSVHAKFVNDLRGAEASGSLLMPTDRDSLMEAISGKINSIEVLKISLKDEVPELATRVEAAVIAKEEMDDPTVISLDDFDNPA